MSSCFVKDLKCFFCCTKQSIEEVDFPEDVFDKITVYRIDQLFWMCELCKNDRRRMIMHLNLVANSENFDSVHNREIDVHSSTNCKGKEIKKFTIQTDKFKKQKDDDMVSMSSENEVTVYKSGSSSSESNSVLSSASSRYVVVLPESWNKDKSALKCANSVLKAIKISHDEESKNRQIVKQVLEETIFPKLKENEDAEPLVNRLIYTGSAFNGLRITSATEYDIDLVLKVPKFVTLTPEFIDAINYAYVKLNWTTNTKDSVGLDSIPVKFLQDNSNFCFLQPQKVLSWLQRHIDLILKQDLKLPSDVLEVKNSACGPGRTIIISTTFGHSISVDLVPVFEFDYTVLRDTPFFDKLMETATEKDVNKSKFLVVPKECKDEENMSVLNAKLCWRLDFPFAEKHILHGKQCAKSVIKLLKIFRDNRKWKDLASYYLKMVVILAIIDNPNQEHWVNGNLFQRLLDCLKHLKDYLRNKCLSHFLTQINLLSKFKSITCDDWSNHLENVIKSVESNPEDLEKLFNPIE